MNAVQKLCMSLAYNIFSFSLCLCIASNAFAAQTKLTKSRLSDLLQQPTVSAVHRDSQGILWIGTQQGLHRYDGVNLTVFDSNRGSINWIPDSEIADIAEDSNGNLFVATSSGTLLKWSRRAAAFNPIITLAPAGEPKLIRLLITENDNIWLLSKNRLSVFNTISEVIADWTTNLELPSIIGTPREILEDSSGNIWLAGDIGVMRLLLEEQSFELLDLSKLGLPQNSRITALGLLNDNELLIGTSNGKVLAWNIVTGSSIASTQLGENARTAIKIFLQLETLLIVGTDRGLYASDRNLLKIDDIGSRGGELSNPNISSFFPDGNYIWVGTIDGLDVLSFSSFELFDKTNSTISNDILTFEEDGNGRLWVGTYDGLYLYDEGTKTHSKFENNLQSSSPDQRVARIAAIGNTLWLGLIQGGVRIIDTVSGKQKMLKLTSNGSAAITKILASDKDEEVLIATYDQGLFRITNNNTESYYQNGILPEKSITTIFRSTAGLLLVASGNKIYRHTAHNDQYQITPLNFGLGENRPVIYSFSQTPSDDILIGTKDHGVFLWTREDQINETLLARPFGNHLSLTYSTIYAIETDSNGNVWCSTESGIVKLDIKGHLLKRFTTADGLQGNDYTLGASFTSQSGHIYFGGMNGYNKFDPTEIETNDTASPMRLTDIILQGKNSRQLGELTELKSLQLTHKDHFVTFQFSVLDFIDAEQNRYRYKLEPFDTEWVENGTRNTATYTNLPPGDYVLRVQGANSAGVWNREGITLDVEMLPAPWNSWWARSLYSVGLLILIWGLFRIHRSYAVERRSIRIAQEMFDAEERADDDMQEQLELQEEIVQTSHQHSLTTLGLVTDCISSRSVNLPDNVRSSISDSSIRRISALATLEDYISFQVGGPIVNLQKYTASIFLDLLKYAPVNPDTIITINDVTERPIPAELASHIAVLIFEILENSVQHAFDQDSPANYIRVSLSLGTNEDFSEEVLELFFSDNGIGVPDNIEELVGEGSGISIVNAIVTKLNGSLHFSGESGTQVTIIIPYDE